MRYRASIAVSALICLLNVTSWALADVNSANNELKACVANHITAEKQKAKPNAEHLLKICSVELEAVLGSLPKSVRHDVRHQIKGDVEKQLK